MEDGCNKNSDDEIKNIAGQVLKNSSKNFHWLNKRLDLEQTMNELGKPFQKIRSKKLKTEKLKCRIWTKKDYGEKSKFGSNKKLGLERTINGLGKSLRKKSNPKNWTKNRENSRNQSEIAL